MLKKGYWLLKVTRYVRRLIMMQFLRKLCHTHFKKGGTEGEKEDSYNLIGPEIVKYFSEVVIIYHATEH